jgi:para-nitrobenzyl esterase
VLAARHTATFFLASLWLSFAAIAASAPRVTLGEVAVTGIAVEGGDVYAWLGLPYAEPPVGALRWDRPRATGPLSDFAATAFAPACMQGDYLVNWYRDLIAEFGGDPDDFPPAAVSEDCLYLNIWRPRTVPADGLPVMVWIHGGSHRGGWSYEPNYMGENLARQGVVVVSIAYRLDVFGFFSHPDLATANFGLLDQVAALEWVQKHIAAFGGNPANVTVFGESAGAASIGYLLAAPVARGLFARAIHQSAGYQSLTTDTREAFVATGRALEQAVLAPAHDGAGNTDSFAGGLAALRRVPAERLLAAAEAVFGDSASTYRPDVVVDGSVVLEPFAASVAAGHIAAVDLLIGTNADEWRMYLENDPEAQLEKRLDALARSAPAAAAMIRETRADAGSSRALDRLITAEQFVCPSLALAQAVNAAGGNSFVYYFDRVRDDPAARRIGAYHGAEIPYVFDTHDNWLRTDAIDRRLTGEIMRFWASFARTGQPQDDDLPEWPPFNAGTAETMRLGDALGILPHPEHALCAAMGSPARVPEP